jgi:hypothetical protein
MAGDLHKRVLLLGPTGVDKRAAVARLNARLKGTLGHQFKFIDYENDFLKPKLAVKHWTVFLAQDIVQPAKLSMCVRDTGICQRNSTKNHKPRRHPHYSQ